MGVVRGNEQNEASNRNQAESHHEDTAFLGSVSGVSTCDRNDAAEDVGRDTHKLGLVIGVPHVLDNSGEEQGDRVKRSIDP